MAPLLIKDVKKVKQKLDKVDAGALVDLNEIYEKLEFYQIREDRVKHVVSLFLDRFGFDGLDISNASSPIESDDSLENQIDLSYRSKPVQDSDIIKENSSDNTTEDYSFDFKANGGSKKLTTDINTAQSSEQSVVSNTEEYVFKLDESDILINTGETDKSKAETALVDLPSGSSLLGAQLSSDPLSSNPFPSNDYDMDVNNNDPNNNTEYEVPDANLAKLNDRASPPRSSSFVPSLDDSDWDFQNQDIIREKLLCEARIIHSVVPRQNFEQIYSYLEANLDDANRLQVVMRIFLDMELGTLQNNVIPMRVITEGDPKEDKIDKVVDLSDDDEVAVILSGNIPNSKLGLNKRKTQCTGKTSPPKKSKCNIDLNLVEVVDLSKDASLHQGSDVKMIDLFKSDAPLEVPSNLAKISRKTQPAIIDVSKSSEPPLEPHNTSVHIHFQTVREMFPTCDEEYLLGTCQKYGEDMASLVSLTEYLLQHPHLPERVHNTSPAVVLPEKLASKENCSKLNIATVPNEPKHNTEKDTSIIRKHLNEKAATDKELHIMEPSSTAGPSSTKEARSHYKVPDDTCKNLLTTTKNGWLVSNLDGSIVKVISTSSKSASNDGVLLLGSQVKSEPDVSIVEVVPTSSNGAKPSSSNNAAGPSTSTNNDSSSLSTPNNDSSSLSTTINDMVESRYQYMLDILPNADPSYLRSECERFMGDEQYIQVFIANALEKRDYPTLEDYQKRQKALALRKKFTSEFSVESFLEVFPNPFKYFIDKGPCADLGKANMYLRNRYPRLRCNDIAYNFSKCGHNLAKTCIQLDKSTSKLFMNKSRKIMNYKIEEEQNLQFLQEVTFVENMDKIEEFLNAKEKKRKESYEEFSDDEEVETRILVGGAETQIGDDKTVFPCLTTCEAEFSLKTLQAVLKPSIFSRMLQRKQMEEVKAAGIEDLESCPFCDFATILPNDDKVFRCLNLDCMKESCRLCKEVNHVPLRCDEVEKSEEIKLRTYIEDRMTQALVSIDRYERLCIRAEATTCWKCKRNFVKEDGCNKMTCSCGAKMCYICRKPVEDYSHFNGQGGTEFEKCPLFSNNNQLHVDAVKQEAIKAKEEVLGQNPTVELKHDPTKNLPNSSVQVEDASDNDDEEYDSDNYDEEDDSDNSEEHTEFEFGDEDTGLTFSEGEDHTSDLDAYFDTDEDYE
uniref:RING-type domain-containing protein n=1 Tax=Timema tahoe TaxID=61484 RepID=A0A7R9FG04_9NEOP|nr:unnamed protein product [Timema tahoe]